MEYESALAGDPERPVARGQGVVVLIDYRDGSKVTLPPTLRDALSALG